MKTLLYIGLMAMMLLAPLSFAQEVAVEELQDKTDAGILPDSALYGLDIAFERISLALTTDPAKKAALALEHANEHLAEAKVEAKLGKHAEKDKALEKQNEALADVEEAKKGLSEAQRQHVQEQLQKHVDKLTAVREKLIAKGVDSRGVDNAIESSSKVLLKVKIVENSADGKPSTETIDNAARNAREEQKRLQGYK